MLIVKKINNNVAEAVDGNGKKLVVFGKGIGFPKVPYELTDLSKISVTYYLLDDYFLKLIEELPEAVLNVSFEIVTLAESTLNETFNQNLVFSLADHINFAIKRMKSYREVKLKFSNDIASLYPNETQVATNALKMIQKELKVVLPESEITALALNLINNRFENQLSEEDMLKEETIEEITTAIEYDLEIQVDRQEFNYLRFRTHLEYYFNRLRSGEQFVDGNKELMRLLASNKGQIYDLTQKIAILIEDKIKVAINSDEMLYLMIHVNRLYEKNRE